MKATYYNICLDWQGYTFYFNKDQGIFWNPDIKPSPTENHFVFSDLAIVKTCWRTLSFERLAKEFVGLTHDQFKPYILHVDAVTGETVRDFGKESAIDHMKMAQYALVKAQHYLALAGQDVTCLCCRSNLRMQSFNLGTLHGILTQLADGH